MSWAYVTMGLLDGITYTKTLSLESEIRIELCILALALPIIDTINISAMLMRLHEKSWIRFHVCNAHMLTYLAALGSIFTISHDAYWIWTYPGIQTMDQRILIQLTPLILYARFCVGTLQRLFEW